jgi:phage shock protein A
MGDNTLHILIRVLGRLEGLVTDAELALGNSEEHLEQQRVQNMKDVETLRQQYAQDAGALRRANADLSRDVRRLNEHRDQWATGHAQVRQSDLTDQVGRPLPPNSYTLS